MRNLPREQVEFLEKAYKKARKVRERYHTLWLLAKGYKRAEVQEIVWISKQAPGDREAKKTDPCLKSTYFQELYRYLFL